MNIKWIIYFGVLIHFKIFVNGEEQLKKCWNMENDPNKNSYFIGDGFTCCNSVFLEHPLKPKSEHWRKCLSQQHGNPEDDLPTTLWSAYMCELSHAASFSEEGATYKQFENFFMTKYPESIKSRILEKNMSCNVPNNANVATKLKLYEECFWKVEEKTCLQMAGVSASVEDNKIVNDSICEPLDKLSKPNHSFMTFAQPCCRGEELPYPLFDVFMDFDRFDLGEKVVSCSENYKRRLMKANQKDLHITEAAHLKMCEVACVHEADGLQGNLNAKFQDLLNFKMKSISKLTKEKLMTTIAKYNPKFQLYGTNETVSMTEAGEVIAKMDETHQILNYCKFQFEATAEAYRALYEYCYNEEYGNQFRDDIIRSTNRPGGNKR